MGPSSPPMPGKTVPTPAERPSRRLSKYANLVWLFQLVFPTLGLAQFLIWFREGQANRPALLLLVFCLVWYGGCFLGLALRPGRRWIATHVAQLCALFLSLAASLAVVETFCRFQMASQLRNKEYSPDLGWSLIPGRGDIGAHGWRKPFYPCNKTSGRFRIVCLGDSTTYGYHCTWQEAWPHQLETFLNQDPDWSKTHGVTEVLNLGVVAYGPDQSLLALKKAGLSYAPDLVIFHLCENDFADASFDHDYWHKTGGETLYKPFFILKEGRLVLGRDQVPLPKDANGNTFVPKTPTLPFSAFLTLLRDQVKPRPSKPSQEEEQKFAEFFDWPLREDRRSEYEKARPLVWALIKEMSRVSSEAGAGFLVTLSPTHMKAAVDNPPWRVARFLSEYQDDARAAGIPALNCVPEYFAQVGNERFLLSTDPFHLNADGNALIARMTQRWVIKEFQAAKHRP